MRVAAAGSTKASPPDPDGGENDYIRETLAAVKGNRLKRRAFSASAARTFTSGWREWKAG